MSQIETVKCPKCKASGRVADPNAAACDPKYVNCERCNGTGGVPGRVVDGVQVTEAAIKSVEEKRLAYKCDCGRGGESLTYESERIETAGKMLKLSRPLYVQRYVCECGKNAVGAEEASL